MTTPWAMIDDSAMQWCPCVDQETHRLLADSSEESANEEYKLWEIIYAAFVLLFMIVALLLDRIGADSVMVIILTLFMVSGIITVEEGLVGFSNEGLLTVVVLFVVAKGISVTGALDWYMGKLLGIPKSIAGAQLRLMIPVAIISAFMNNTPVVVIMIPIVIRWAKNIKVSPQQLLVPLSYASILGGTCTLIGTSTNLVIVDLLKDRYPDDTSLHIGLFDLGEYGVPIAIVGITYIIVASPFLLPGGRREGNADILADSEQVLLGARLNPWSPAAGRSVKRSGLRDTGGIFLVSVQRAITGNIHRAVGQDFVLNVGDILYFTGLVESFGDFCEEHGLEVITNESTNLPTDDKENRDHQEITEVIADEGPEILPETMNAVTEEESPPIVDIEINCNSNVPTEIGCTASSLLAAHETDRLQIINRMTDQIRENPLEENKASAINVTASVFQEKPAQIVVTTDSRDSQRLVLIGINAPDRPGLLLDISKGLLRLKLELRHTEATVINERSLSIWRCEGAQSDLPDLEAVWEVLNALLEVNKGIQAMKKRGLRVIRAIVTDKSSLVGLTAAQANFRHKYKAAIIARQKGGKNVTIGSSFDVGDVLILQASDNSPLLKKPSPDFYDNHESSQGPSRPRSGINLKKMVNQLFNEDKEKEKDSHSHGKGNKKVEDKDFFIPDDIESSDDSNDPNNNSKGAKDVTQIDQSDDSMSAPQIDTGASMTVTAEHQELVWSDLRVVSVESRKATDSGMPPREFLTAMEVAKKSALINKTVDESGLTNLPGVFLVSIERPVIDAGDVILSNNMQRSVFSNAASIEEWSHNDAGSIRPLEPSFETMAPDDTLEAGDVLWFSGTAAAVGDLRKIPGLRSFDSDQVDKINESPYERRLVQAVVAKRGPLVGKTVRSVRFRTKYGAAVIAVHREGKRVHDHPGQIKLQGGDVLLLEAGPTFIKQNADNDQSFALLAEVEDSAPPRLEKLIPALILTVAMLVVYTAGGASLFVCALVASILMVALCIMTEQEARNAVKWDVYVTIACSFGIGTALVNSGVASGIATGLVFVGESLSIGDAGLYGAVYLATFLISSVVTNNAAAVLLFPIAMDAAEQTGADPLLMSYTLMLGASASFMSPFGYQTNLLIYGPGGYKFADFVMMGGPMQIVLWLFSVTIISIEHIWWPSWVISLTLFFAVASILLTKGKFTNCMPWRSHSHSLADTDL